MKTVIKYIHSFFCLDKGFRTEAVAHNVITNKYILSIIGIVI